MFLIGTNPFEIVLMRDQDRSMTIHRPEVVIIYQKTQNLNSVLEFSDQSFDQRLEFAFYFFDCIRHFFDGQDISGYSGTHIRHTGQTYHR